LRLVKDRAARFGHVQALGECRGHRTDLSADPSAQVVVLRRRAKQPSENGVGYAEKILKAQHFNLLISTLTVHCSAIDLTARVNSGSPSKS
jgi:hypothetical protein